MAAPKPFKIRETRILTGTTFNTSYTAASNAAWAAGTASKLRTQGPIDLSGLVYNSESDETIESQLYAGRAPIPTTRNGNVKFSMFLEGAESDTSANILATVLSKIMGGVSTPATARADVAEALGSTTTINATSHGMVAGQAVLVGAKGDARGAGEVRVITNPSTNSFDLLMATSGTADDPDALVFGTTVYLLDTTQSYIDGLVIGQSAEDQLQWLGAMGPFALENLDPGQVPRVTFDLQVGDWQEVPSGERDQLEPTSAALGNAPAVNRGLGGFFLGDNGDNTRAAHKIADLSIDPGISFQPIEDPNGVNGIGGFIRVPSAPSMEFTVLLEGGADPLPGFHDDFTAGTAKQVLAQFGATAQKCAAVDMHRCYFEGAPVRTEVNGKMGVKCKLVGTAAGHDGGTAATALINSPMRIHFF